MWLDRKLVDINLHFVPEKLFHQKAIWSWWIKVKHITHLLQLVINSFLHLLVCVRALRNFLQTTAKHFCPTGSQIVYTILSRKEPWAYVKLLQYSEASPSAQGKLFIKSSQYLTQRKEKLQSIFKSKLWQKFPLRIKFLSENLFIQ